MIESTTLAKSVVRGDIAYTHDSIEQKSSGGMWTVLSSPTIASIGGRPIPEDSALMAEYALNGDVYTCVNINANAVAKTRWRLLARKGGPSTKGRETKSFSLKELGDNPVAEKHRGMDVEEIVRHPILDLLNQMNNNLSPFQLWNSTSKYMDVFGGCYWRIINGSFGLPTKIVVIPTQMLKTLVADDMTPAAYIYTPILPQSSGTQIQYAAKDIIDLRFPGIENPASGREPPLRSVYGQAELSSRYLSYMNALFKNRARVDQVFIPKEQISQLEIDRLEAQWNSKFGGGGNGRTKIAPGPGQVIPTSYSPTDLGELKISQDNARRISNAYGVPEALLSKDSTYANMAASFLLHAMNAVLPRIILIQDTLNTRLVPLYGDDLFLAAVDPTPKDKQIDLQAGQIGAATGVATRNEIREKLGFERTNNPDDDKMPENNVEAADQVTGDGLPRVATDEPQSPGNGMGQRGPEAIGGTALGSDAGSAASKMDLVSILKLNESVQSGAITRKSAIALAVYLGTEPGVAKDLIVAKSDPPAPEKPKKKDLSAALAGFFAGQKNHWGALGNWLPGSETLNHDDQALAALLLLTLEPEAEAEASRLAVKAGETAIQARQAVLDARKMTSEDAAQFASLINRTTLNRVQSAVKAAERGNEASGLADGSPEAKAQIDAAAQEVFDAAIESRSPLIASDMQYRAKMRGQLGVLHSTSRILTKTWVTAEDEKVCPICEPLDGQTVKAGEMFETQIGPADGPILHVRCRCSLSYTSVDGDTFT